jgi:hypothetical protein
LLEERGLGGLGLTEKPIQDVQPMAYTAASRPLARVQSWRRMSGGRVVLYTTCRSQRKKAMTRNTPMMRRAMISWIGSVSFASRQSPHTTRHGLAGGEFRSQLVFQPCGAVSPSEITNCTNTSPTVTSAAPTQSTRRSVVCTTSVGITKNATMAIAKAREARIQRQGRQVCFE